ncbi:MAG TPA: peptidoglycan-binding protein [Clostridiales bacterium]|nr:peptidoglycan-binding protein [Clostridiales bacterium]
MYSSPERMNEPRVRMTVVAGLCVLLAVVVALLIREVRAPGSVKAVEGQGTPTPNSGVVMSLPTDVPPEYLVGGFPTDVPTEIPTPTPTPTAVPTPTPRPTEIITLRKGDKSENVRALQQRLIELKYLKEGEADGNFGSGTKKAVQQFQQNNGLAPDGVAGRDTQLKLFSNEAR